jgi:hypothetical protein
MKGKTWLSIIGLATGGMLALVFLLVSGGTAGEWHAGTTNVCTDCHTMHFSMQHNWAGGTLTPGNAASPDGNWLSTSGPNQFLLKAPANQLCLACHDGQTFAPDVLGINVNPSPTQGRSAGALNEPALGAPFDSWKGHTLGSTDTPPGFNPTAAGVPATQQYNATSGLECISCHLQHGSAAIYRNLGPRTAAFQPTYVLGTTNNTSLDVWINASGYTANSGSAATFNPLYDTANVSYNRTLGITAPTGATMTTSNRLDTFCSACHANFHGGPGDANIGGSAAALDGFIRHPTSNVVIGASGAQGFGGHSALSRFVNGGGAASTKVKVYANDRAGYTDASPGCVTCHKAHGNQNPFGLIFLNRNAASVNEQGGYASGQSEMANGYGQGYRNLCGQCHGQGN